MTHAGAEDTGTCLAACLVGQPVSLNTSLGQHMHLSLLHKAACLLVLLPRLQSPTRISLPAHLQGGGMALSACLKAVLFHRTGGLPFSSGPRLPP